MKIMLDECMTKRASKLIIDALQLHKPTVVAEFLEDHQKADGTPFGKGMLDPDWVKTLADQGVGEWCVITCDSDRPKGERAKLKGPPLHLILPERKITGFFLGGSMASQSGFEKFRAVIYLLPEILENCESQPGTRFKITRSGSGYQIKEWPMTSNLQNADTTVPPPPS